MDLPPAPLPPVLPRPEGPSSALLSVWLAATRLAGPAGPAILKRRLAAGKEDPARWPEKLGRAGAARPAGRLVWVHAVSVGEGLSVLPLLKALVAAEVTVLLTCTTVTAAFLPLDLPGPVARFLDHWRPDLAVLVESEFWPRLITACHARGVPLALVNARVSDASARNWRRAPGLARAMLGSFAVLTAPDARVAGILAELGADPARIRQTGSLKRGTGRLPVEPAAIASLRGAYAGRRPWLAASTHPGEEETVLDALSLLQDPARPLILAPRHPNRGAALREMITARGFSVAQRSTGEAPGKAQVYLADTLGEMGLWFDLCPVAFIGGSLVPVGGHNAYEAVAHGAAVLTGPEVANFTALYDRLLMSKGAVMVRDAGELAKAVRHLDDPTTRTALTAAAEAAITTEGDATAETAALILSLLKR